ncbi:MAG: hypothetical protein SPJ13_00845, partial [Bacteroidales bacterium]|nr:hypothetical protein [Bacteroidales bacterium]
MLDINAIDLSGLAPERRDGISLFPDPNLEILKIDLYFDAGAAYQPKLLVAGAANALFTEGTPCHTAHEIAEFLEYRGVEIDRTVGQTYAGFSFFLLPR